MSFDKDKIAEEAKEFYTKLFMEEHVIRPRFDGIDFPTMSVADSINLEKPFTEEEVKQVVMKFGTNKAPGPDGFTM